MDCLVFTWETWLCFSSAVFYGVFLGHNWFPLSGILSLCETQQRLWGEKEMSPELPLTQGWVVNLWNLNFEQTLRPKNFLLPSIKYWSNQNKAWILNADQSHISNYFLSVVLENMATLGAHWVEFFFCPWNPRIIMWIRKWHQVLHQHGGES